LDWRASTLVRSRLSNGDWAKGDVTVRLCPTGAFEFGTGLTVVGRCVWGHWLLYLTCHRFNRLCELDYVVKMPTVALFVSVE
jgi:hypothetical protein